MPIREPVRLTTPRLLMRGWRESDRDPFAAMNADPAVMEYFQAPLTGELIGFTGLHPVPARIPVDAAGPEIGWRLARRFWGAGYASEAARAALDFGFGNLGVPEIVSFTAATNVRSQAVMERIGMTRDPHGDFDHPRLPEGHRLRRHVLYRRAGPPRPMA